MSRSPSLGEPPELRSDSEAEDNHRNRPEDQSESEGGDLTDSEDEGPLIPPPKRPNDTPRAESPRHRECLGAQAEAWAKIRCNLFSVAHSACGAAELGARLHACLSASPGLMPSLLGGFPQKPSGGGGRSREILPLPIPPFAAAKDADLMSLFRD